MYPTGAKGWGTSEGPCDTQSTLINVHFLLNFLPGLNWGKSQWKLRKRQTQQCTKPKLPNLSHATLDLINRRVGDHICGEDRTVPITQDAGAEQQPIFI